MPRKIDAPPCVRAFLAQLYPNVNIDGIRFYEGVPFYTFPRGAITIGPNIYFREGRYDPCSCQGIALLAHELYHIHQGADGFGFWFLRPYYVKYVWFLLRSGFKSDRRHRLEEPAYDLQDRIVECCDRVHDATGQGSPCICQDGTPATVNEAFLKAFAEECPDPLAREKQD
jgi:hypothetical protein